MSNKIDEILEEKRRRQEENPESTFFQMLRIQGAFERYLEFRFRNGVRTAFRYDDLKWFNYDPEKALIDLDFGGCAVLIEGRGLHLELFEAIKTQRISWIREAGAKPGAEAETATDPQALFISDITIVPPDHLQTPEEEEALA